MITPCQVLSPISPSMIQKRNFNEDKTFYECSDDLRNLFALGRHELPILHREVRVVSHQQTRTQ